MQIIEKINLDMAHEYAKKHRFKQFDTNTRVCEFFITNNNKPLNLRDMDAYVYFKKADNRVVFIKVDEKDFIDGSTFKVTLTNNVLAVAGPLRAEITLMSKCTEGEEASILTTNKVNFYVEPILRDDTAIESTNEFLGIQHILDKINDVDDIVSKLENLHTHSNLEILESITQEKLSFWDGKADSVHEHTEYALKSDIENTSIEITENITVIEDSISDIELSVEQTESKIESVNVALDNLTQEVRAGVVLEITDEELDDIINFLDI